MWPGDIVTDQSNAGQVGLQGGGLKMTLRRGFRPSQWLSFWMGSADRPAPGHPARRDRDGRKMVVGEAREGGRRQWPGQSRLAHGSDTEPCYRTSN